MKTMKTATWLISMIIAGFIFSRRTNAADFNTLRRSLVVVETDSGSGSGFVVEMGGKRYVMTNQHVVRAAKNIQLRLADGQMLMPKALELAAEHDAVRILFESPGNPPHSLTVASAPPSIGHTVKIFGNSEGMGVITELAGKILGVGPDNVEVDAGFVRGNSGSPIIDQTGHVIGIATFITLNTPDKDWVIQGTRFERIRRFGIRLTDNIRWVPATFEAFYQQTKLLEDTSCYLSDVFLVMCCWFDGEGRSQAQRDLFAYASESNPSLFGRSQWEKRFMDFVKAYKDYWNARVKLSEKSMTVQSTRARLQKLFESMPYEPQINLQKTQWLTPSFQKESERMIEVMALLQREVQKITKDENRFWRGNVLDRRGYY